MKSHTTQHQMEGLAVLLLFGVFALCILSVLLTGAGAYKRLTERDRAAYDRRTAEQYLATRVRQADTSGQVSIGTFPGEEDISALLLSEDFGDALYITYVYCFDGYLRELFIEAGGDFSPEDGEKVLELQSLNFTGEGRTIHAELESAEGVPAALTLSLRSGEGASA